jgi:hypothetical protein
VPYASKAQQGYFHAHKAEMESKGVNVNEWDQASKGQRGLPEHTMKKEKGTEKLTEPEAKPLKAEGKSGDEHKGGGKGEHHKKATAPKGAELHSITTARLPMSITTRTRTACRTRRRMSIPPPTSKT